jgi:uncharacterized RDD family membrane protein YckC
MSITAIRSTRGMMPATLNFRGSDADVVGVMNAIAQVSAAPTTGPKLDNRRVVAGVVDLLIVAAGGALVLFAGDSLTGERQSALGAVILGWALYYFFAMESGDGQTVGKKLMKLRVVRTNGSPVGMREVAVRTVLRVVDNYLVGLIVMLATGDRRQRIGDLAAGTIIVDASAPAAPVAEQAVEAVEADEPAAPAPEAPAVPDPLKTITLPARPSRPATLEDLTEPAEEAEASEDERVAEEPVAEAPVVEEPVAEEPVAEAPAVEEPVVEEPAAEIAPVPLGQPVEGDEDPLPDVTSPSLEELAQDVAGAKVEDAPAEEALEDEPAQHEPAEDEPDTPMTVKSVETVSAIDLVMGGAPEEDSEDGTEQPARDPEGPASA